MTKILFDSSPLTVEDIRNIAKKNVEVKLQDSEDFKSLINKGPSYLKHLWNEEKPVYGVTTGVGDSVIRSIPRHLVPEFSKHLARFHGVGLGQNFSSERTRAILAVRLSSLCRGYSGVRYQLLENLTEFLKQDILPRIPEEGSVGASGDLTPLSYIAAVLMGERQVFVDGELAPSTEALTKAEIEILELLPKEGLAIMNGTSVMTALATEAWDRANYLVELTTRITSIISEAMLGNKAHFDDRIFAAKPHPQQRKVAARIAEDIEYHSGYERDENERLQDTYAVRCAPHIIGVLADALPWMKTQIETELNSANDNPLIDPEDDVVLHGGNFYGGHMAFVTEGIMNGVAHLADLADRQVAMLVNEKSNRGLSPNLSGAPQGRESINHAFKATHIATSAWAAEALKNANPASYHSRSTESHNQDKVSMGTIAARSSLRVIELTEQVVAATLLVAVQAIELRVQSGELKPEKVSPNIKKTWEEVRKVSEFITEDRELEGELRVVIQMIRDQKFDLNWKS